MRTLFLFICSISGFTSYAQNNSQHTFQDMAELEKGKYQGLINARTSQSLSTTYNYNINYYRAEWEVDPRVKFIKGKITSYFAMTEASDQITVDLVDNMKVSQVLQRNVPLTYTHSDGMIRIKFPSVRPADSMDSVSIIYEGIPNAGVGFVPTIPALWTSSQPNSSFEWWPCKNGTGEKADSMDIYITHPEVYKAVTNGLRQSVTPAAGSRAVTHWKHRYPIATYLMAIAISDYIRFSSLLPTASGQFLMETYCLAKDEGAFKSAEKTVTQANAWLTGLVGDYPFAMEKYAHVQSFGNGNMENQTCSFLGDPGEYIVAHEFAHHWFGDKITCKTWEDIWLNEGFATFVGILFLENKNPDRTMTRRLSTIDIITAYPDGSVKADAAEEGEILNGRLRYYKGAYLLYMLRWILGDDIFWTAIRNYLNDPALAYGLATTADLQKHFESVSGKDLTYFFDQWYTGQGYPSYRMEWTPAGTKVKFRLDQVTSHSSVKFFNLPVPVLFGNKAGGQQKLITVNHQKSGEVFEEEIGFEADTVTIDPDLVLISKDNIIKQTGNLVLGENKTDFEIKIFPNPVQDALNVQITMDNPLSFSATIYDLTGRATCDFRIQATKGNKLYAIEDLKGLPAGLYTLRVKSENGRFTKTFSFLKF